MDKMMDNPWFLRIISLLFAVLLFISVQNELEGNEINTAGTSVESIQNVPVDLYYDDDNLVVTGAPETVTLNIQGPSNLVLSAQTMRDYTLFIDLRNLPLGEHEVEVQYENLPERLEVRTDPQTVKVTIEERISETFTVEPDMNERLLADNYVVKSTNVEPNRVTVTGARSIIESISFVKATVSGEQGLKDSFEQQASVRVLDRDLNKLDVMIEPQEVTVSVEIEQYSKEVPITLEEQGSPADDVTVDELSTSISNVRVYGARTAVDAIDTLTIPVDVSDIRESGTIQVPIELPEGVTSASRKSVPVRVAVTVEEPVATPEEEASDAGINVDEEADDVSTTRTFEDVPIVVAGLAEQWSSTFTIPSDGVVNVTATGPESEINKLTAADVQVEVDASEVSEEGEYSLPLSVTGNETVTWAAELTQATIVVATA